jgi:flagellar protein FliS
MITVANVVNATQLELVCLTYELFLEALDQAITANLTEEKKYRQRAREILLSLAENLCFESEIAHYLFKIYIYVQNLLINGKQKKHLKEAYDLIYTIYDGYKELLNQENQKKQDDQEHNMIQHAQDIYAGMTYGKGQLNEIVIEEKDRGFKA